MLAFPKKYIFWPLPTVYNSVMFDNLSCPFVEESLSIYIIVRIESSPLVTSRVNMYFIDKDSICIDWISKERKGKYNVPLF